MEVYGVCGVYVLNGNGLSDGKYNLQLQNMNSDLYFLSQIWINGNWGEVSILISVIYH